MSTETKKIGGKRGNLAITRTEGEVLWIGDARVEVVSIKGNRVKIAVVAPIAMKILRDELRPLPEAEVVELLGSAQTEMAWNGYYDRIVKGYGGNVPPFWKEAVIDSGLIEKVTKRLQAGSGK